LCSGTRATFQTCIVELWKIVRENSKLSLISTMHVFVNKWLTNYVVESCENVPIATIFYFPK